MNDLARVKDMISEVHQEIDDRFSLDDPIYNERLCEAQGKANELIELLESIEPTSLAALGV